MEMAHHTAKRNLKGEAMSASRIAAIERDIGNHELILNMIKELYMDSRQTGFREPTVSQIFHTIAYIHAQIETKAHALKRLKNVKTSPRLP